MSLEIHAAHFNHMLRGESSSEDEQFCRDLCERLGVGLSVGSGDVKARSKETGESLEAAARDMRYRFLAETATKRDSTAVTTGHTMDDQAETVLLAITRGAGLRGLSGMAWSTERADLVIEDGPLRIIRPMLALRRTDTEEFCELSDVVPQQDDSNLDLAFARNRVRYRVIPELRQINPEVVEAIARMATVATDDIRLIDDMAREALADATADESGGIFRRALREMAPALRTHVLAAAYRQASGSLRDLDMVSLTAASDAVSSIDSGSIDLPNSARLVIEHDVVRILIGDSDLACPYPIEVGNHVLHILKTLQFDDGASISARIVWPAPEPASLNRWQAIVNPEVISEQRFEVRARRNGDRFHALGMETEMKLQDFMVNRHIPARWRDRVPLLLTERGICWVVGEEIADWAKVPEGANEAVLLQYEGPD